MILYDFSSKQWCLRQTDPSEWTLQDAIAHILTMINQFAYDLRDFYCSTASPYEASSWSLKKNEANGFSIGNPTPMLDIEAQARGVTTADLASKILAKATALAQLEAVISGTCGRHQDIVSQLTDISSVLDYDWSVGWPI